MPKGTYLRGVKGLLRDAVSDARSLPEADRKSLEDKLKIKTSKNTEAKVLKVLLEVADRLICSFIAEADNYIIEKKTGYNTSSAEDIIYRINVFGANFDDFLLTDKMKNVLDNQITKLNPPVVASSKSTSAYVPSQQPAAAPAAYYQGIPVLPVSSLYPALPEVPAYSYASPAAPYLQQQTLPSRSPASPAAFYSGAPVPPVPAHVCDHALLKASAPAMEDFEPSAPPAPEGLFDKPAVTLPAGTFYSRKPQVGSVPPPRTQTERFSSAAVAKSYEEEQFKFSPHSILRTSPAAGRGQGRS